MDILLSPHNDDETLFAAYTCLRYKPLVVVCIRAPEAYGPPEMREAETGAAMHVLGCDWVQLDIDGDDPDWDLLCGELSSYRPERVWAPHIEPLGHAQHNAVGEIAQKVWPDGVTYYTTYTHKLGRTIGDQEVVAQRGWERRKRRALECYVSQRTDPRTRMHFTRPLAEYYASASARR